jgi:hypothetical protein
MVHSFDKLIRSRVQIILLESVALLELDCGFQSELVRVIEDVQSLHVLVAIRHLFAIRPLLLLNVTLLLGRQGRYFGVQVNQVVYRFSVLVLKRFVAKLLFLFFNFHFIIYIIHNDILLYFIKTYSIFENI